MFDGNEFEQSANRLKCFTRADRRKDVVAITCVQVRLGCSSERPGQVGLVHMSLHHHGPPVFRSRPRVESSTAEREFAAITSSFCGWRADIPTLRRLHPALLDFDSWAEEGKPLLEKHFREADECCSLSCTECGE
jgi:hypothetical protein